MFIKEKILIPKGIKHVTLYYEKEKETQPQLVAVKIGELTVGDQSKVRTFGPWGWEDEEIKVLQNQ